MSQLAARILFVVLLIATLLGLAAFAAAGSWALLHFVLWLMQTFPLVH